MLGWLKERSETIAKIEPAPGEDRAVPLVEFRCAPEDLGVIAPPVPAKQMLPDWFRHLSPVLKEALSPGNNALTVKRCMPFVDALSFGWIIPLAATVRMEIGDGGARIDCGWDFDKEMVSPHGPAQVAGHPRLPMPPMKFHNHWTIATPPGWSCLFVPPINRPNGLFEAASGIVDTDRYDALIHFPFFATAGDGVHILPKGTPIVQVIPFRRSASPLAMRADIRAETPGEAEARERTRRATMAGDGWYREEVRAKRS